MTDDEDKAAEPHYKDHRKRLRQRFLAGGADALPDYELLELLLTLAIPQKDVKPLAKSLIARFGSFNQVLTASPEALQEVDGIKEAAATALKVIQAAAQRLARQEVMNRPVLASWDKLLDYCHISLAHRDIEQFHLLFLDRKNVLIADEAQQRGTVDHTPVYPREIVKRALELAATAVLLVHNHPSGDPTPSTQDVKMTLDIIAVAAPLGVTVHDHIIVGRQGHASLKGMRFI